MMDKRMLIAALCAIFSLNAEAKLYKWVDDNGTTHYGETIPPEYANKNAVKLEKGHIEKRDDQFGQGGKKAAALKDPVSEQARIEAERRDNALINTYSSEQEIDLARDRNLQQVEARAGSYATLLKSAQENLASLQKEYEQLVQQHRKIPQSLEEDLDDAKNHISKLQNDIEINTKERDVVVARYAADKARYRELRGLAPEPAKQSTKK